MKLSMSQAALRLGVHPNTLRTLANMGRIACERAHNGHRVFDEKIIAKELKRRIKTPSLLSKQPLDYCPMCKRSFTEKL